MSKSLVKSVVSLKIFQVIIFGLCIIFTSKLSAQNFIKGTITDSAKTPVPFCALALMNYADSSIVKGNLTNENGEFIFETISSGKYIIKINQVGFIPFLSQIIYVDSANSIINLNPMVLKNAVFNLKEVSVSAFKPTVEFKKGITVLNIENNLIYSGNTVLELLKRLPGVTIDNQNNIFINGKSGARFLIDGKLQNISGGQIINILNSMNAESVSSIELIKNPPAKYDAAGTAGLINIVLKKGKFKGFNGSLYNLNGQGKFFRNTSALNLNFKSNKWSVYSNLTYMNLYLSDIFKFYRNTENLANSSIINENGTDIIHRVVSSGNLGIEYDVNAKSSIGVNLSGGPSNSAHKQSSIIDIPSGTQFPYNYLVSNSVLNDDFNNPNFNINGLHKFDTLGTQLQLSADITNFTGYEKKINENNFYDLNNIEIYPMFGNISETKRDFKILTQKLDFTKIFKNEITLESGLKTSFVNNINNFKLQQNNETTGLYYLDTLFSNTYNYKEKILAGYFILSKNFKKINIQAGLRAEQTIIQAINQTTKFNLERNYLNLFPNGSINYTINKKNSLQLSYSYRIDRPDYSSLNPVKIFWNRLDYKAGNPYLLPQYSHNINFDFYCNSFIVNSLNFSNTAHSFYGYSYTNSSTKINTDTLLNFGQRNNLAYTLFIQKQLKWYNVQFTGVALYRNFIGTLNSENANSETFFYSCSINNEFNLANNFKIQCYGMYNSPVKESLQLYKPYSSVNFVIQKSLFNKTLFLSIGIHDIFYKEITGITTTFSNQSTFLEMKNDSRRVRFTLNYKFGKLHFQQKTKKSNEEENNRLKNLGK